MANQLFGDPSGLAAIPLVIAILVLAVAATFRLAREIPVRVTSG